MFVLEFPSIKCRVRDVIRALSQSVGQCEFELQPEGVIYTFATNASRTLYITCSFNCLVAEFNENVKNIFVDLTGLAKICKFIPEMSNFKIYSEKSVYNDYRKISLCFDSKEYSLNLLDNYTKERMFFGDEHYKCSIIMSSFAFADVCKSFSRFGDEIIIEYCNENKTVIFNVVGYLVTGKVTFYNCKTDGDVIYAMNNLSLNDCNNIPIKINVSDDVLENFSSVYSCNQLKCLSQACQNLSSTVCISLSNDNNLPLRLTYSFNEWCDKEGFVTYYICPKIYEE